MRSTGLWLRGGFPESFLAESDPRNLRWRQDFIRSYLEREIPQFGRHIAAETLWRFWTMLAHHQGGLLNTAQFARNLGVDVKTTGGYLDLLVDLLLVRRPQPWHANLRKRLFKSPKTYVRDSGLVHALLNIPDKETLQSHPVVGASWEGFVIGNLLANAARSVQPYFYRASGGAEVDLRSPGPTGDCGRSRSNTASRPRSSVVSTPHATTSDPSVASSFTPAMNATGSRKTSRQLRCRS